MWKKHKIIILPTEENAPIFKIGNWNKLYDSTEILSTNPADFAQDESYQHLYILSDEDIKEGDWVVDIHNSIYQQNSDKIFEEFTGAKRIMATTDSSLTILRSDPECINEYYLPAIPQSFIDLYIEEYNKGNAPVDVEVEYERYLEVYGEDERPVAEYLYRLKTDSNNCISIRRSKESWNREEVITLLTNLPNFFNNSIPEQKRLRDKWIEQNL